MPRTKKTIENTKRPDLLGNKYALGNKGGKPLKYETPQELEQLIESYFNWCQNNYKPITITGLAVALDTTRTLLHEYKKREDEYGNIVRRAITIVEQNWEERLVGANAGGAIFWLKNHGWKDTPDYAIQNNLIILPNEIIGKNNLDDPTANKTT